MATLDLGLLVSGNGTNLQAILDAVRAGSLDARVRVVLSNRADAFAVKRAERAGVPAEVLSHKDFSSRERFDEALVTELREHGAEWIVLAGFMRVLTPVFLKAFEARIVNVHPALLPSFKGTHAEQQALDYGVKVTGCTVHFVDEGVDSGPIILQRAVPIEDGDDVERLHARMQIVEHELLVESLRAISENRVELRGGTGSRTVAHVRPR